MINIFYRIVGSKRVALILDCIGIAFGAVIAAFAIEEFLVPCTILDGGVVGIGIMINSLAHIPLGILTIVFNIPFLAVGSRQLGKLFIVKSAFGMTVFSTFLQIFAPLRNVTNEYLLAVCFGGVLLGVGVGLVIRFGGCLDGTETVAILLNKKFVTIQNDKELYTCTKEILKYRIAGMQVKEIQIGRMLCSPETLKTPLKNQVRQNAQPSTGCGIAKFR